MPTGAPAARYSVEMVSLFLSALGFLMSSVTHTRTTPELRLEGLQPSLLANWIRRPWSCGVPFFLGGSGEGPNLGDIKSESKGTRVQFHYETQV